jgi:hypothetical protein
MSAGASIIDRALLERWLAQIAAWPGPAPRTVISEIGAVLGISKETARTDKKLPADKKKPAKNGGSTAQNLSPAEKRAVAQAERKQQRIAVTQTSSNVITLQARVVRIMRENGAWLVVVGGHGWLHGDRRAALADARWLAGNFGLPIRRHDREGAS